MTQANCKCQSNPACFFLNHCNRDAKCATKFYLCFSLTFCNRCTKVYALLLFFLPFSLHFCLCFCLQQPVPQSWKTWAFLMNSATPHYGHPFAYPGIILEEDHLRTLKVTALGFIDVDTHETTRENVKTHQLLHLSANSLISSYFFSCRVSHVSFHIFDVCNIQLEPMHDNIGVSSTKVRSKYLDSDVFFMFHSTLVHYISSETVMNAVMIKCCFSALMVFLIHIRFTVYELSVFILFSGMCKMCCSSRKVQLRCKNPQINAKSKILTLIVIV